MQRLPKLIEPPVLYEAINTFRGGEGGSLRVLDCLFSPGRRPDPEYFRENFYGKFEQQVQEDDGVQNCFLRFLYSHIPGAIHCNLGMATFPSSSGHDKYAVYPAAIFQNYAQLLGLNSDDHLVFYGRGPFGGMLFASRLYWLFRAYGHSGGLSLLNGGFDAWLQSNLSVESGTVKDMDPVFSKTPGNWTAKTEASSGTITFEELTTNSGKTLNTEAILLDARPRAQFEGHESHFDASQEMPPGCRLPGTLNIPAPEFINSEGKIKGPEELGDLIENAGLNIDKMKRAQEKPLVTLCNSGMQASLLATALDIQLGLGERTRVYNGSMLEMQARAPELISEGSMRDDDDKDVNNAATSRREMD